MTMRYAKLDATATAARVEASIPAQSPDFTAASVISFEPMPAATMPAPNHLAMEASSGSTPPSSWRSWSCTC